MKSSRFKCVLNIPIYFLMSPQGYFVDNVLEKISISIDHKKLVPEHQQKCQNLKINKYDVSVNNYEQISYPIMISKKNS